MIYINKVITCNQISSISQNCCSVFVILWTTAWYVFYWDHKLIKLHFFNSHWDFEWIWLFDLICNLIGIICVSVIMFFESFYTAICGCSLEVIFWKCKLLHFVSPTQRVKLNSITNRCVIWIQLIAFRQFSTGHVFWTITAYKVNMQSKNFCIPLWCLRVNADVEVVLGLNNKFFDDIKYWIFF